VGEIGYAFAVHTTNKASGAVAVRAISVFFIVYLLLTRKTD
jgi:hypothetical protein